MNIGIWEAKEPKFLKPKSGDKNIPTDVDEIS